MWVALTAWFRSGNLSGSRRRTPACCCPPGPSCPLRYRTSSRIRGYLFLHQQPSSPATVEKRTNISVFLPISENIFARILRDVVRDGKGAKRSRTFGMHSSLRYYRDQNVPAFPETKRLGAPWGRVVPRSWHLVVPREPRRRLSSSVGSPCPFSFNSSAFILFRCLSSSCRV